MRSVSLINPSGRVVRVIENRVPHLVEQGFRIAASEPAKTKNLIPPPEDLSEKSLDELREIARDMGLYESGLHPATGVAKTLAAIEAARRLEADED